MAESLSLQGSLSAGEFRSSRLGTGHWRLSGHTLTLDTGSQVHAFDLTFHDAGRIGLEAGPGRRRVFVRRTSNVVPLRRANR